ncbi:MAG: hypothetical protein IKG58_04270 [Bacilli bacterium]|nr:hypothetical protein [Bacilli bacterium]MBR3049750.1 hypothetical protein [Bacilli bacterium]
MIKINNIKFEEKFSEANIRYRVFEDKNVITLIINTEFYPSVFKDNVVSGAIEAKIDIEGINKVDDLENTKYEGKIGNVTISVNNDGVWEHESYEDFKVEIKDINNRKIKLSIKTDTLNMNTTATLVSLYTTSTSREKLLKRFDLNNFYDKPVIRKIGNNEVYKYFAKE